MIFPKYESFILEMKVWGCNFAVSKIKYEYEKIYLDFNCHDGWVTISGSEFINWEFKLSNIT